MRSVLLLIMVGLASVATVAQLSAKGVSLNAQEEVQSLREGIFNDTTSQLFALLKKISDRQKGTERSLLKIVSRLEDHDKRLVGYGRISEPTDSEPSADPDARGHDSRQDYGSSYHCSSCPDGFLRCGGRCYHLLSTLNNFNEAEAGCLRLGAHLATPRSTEDNLCAAIAARKERVWLGVTDRVREGEFVAADEGGPVVADWFSDQPDNNPWAGEGRQGEDCVEMTVRDGRAGWNDANCDNENPALCQLVI